jgi:3-hydroxyacyl-[acyl-carrier-protein] dehydratase
MMFNKEQVMKFLPHRDPFLFIDYVKEVSLPEALQGQKGPFAHQQLMGTKSVCGFKVDHSVKVLEGHFPGNPILPGVVQIEMMAQAASFIAPLAFDRPIEEMRLTVALTTVESAKFRKPIVPPMDLEVSAVLTKVRGSFWTYECQIHSGQDLMAQCTVMATIRIE